MGGWEGPRLQAVHVPDVVDVGHGSVEVWGPDTDLKAKVDELLGRERSDGA